MAHCRIQQIGSLEQRRRDGEIERHCGLPAKLVDACNDDRKHAHRGGNAVHDAIAIVKLQAWRDGNKRQEAICPSSSKRNESGT